MVSLKPDNLKPNGSMNRQKSQSNQGTFLLFVVGLVFTILFVAQLWTACFFYGKLSNTDRWSQSLKIQLNKEIRSLLNQELTSYLEEQLQSQKISSLEDYRSKSLKNIPERSYEAHGLPRGPPMQSLEAKDWFFSTQAEEEIYQEDIPRIEKRSISQNHEFNDPAVEPHTEYEDYEKDESPGLQLTSYAKIPYETIQEFCSRTRSSCPAGPKGVKGLKGDRGLMGIKGNRGERGLPGKKGRIGEKGLLGEKGQRGPLGNKGNRGLPGKNGIDGRDGLPGEPGLDGIPGRHGMDGKDGKCSAGRNGRPGQDGTDGKKGERGKRGEPGVKGQRGMTGPRGRAGKNGDKGDQGKAGVTIYTVNGTKCEKSLIPPAFTDTAISSKILKVKEHTRLRLACHAAGKPNPFVEWTRLDHLPIRTGFWQDGTIEGEVLNISHVGREHTGKYMCEAYNGIGLSAKRIFELKVEFEPYIRVIQWKVGVHMGELVSLVCHVESFPQAVTYWRNQEGRLLENSTRYTITELQQDPSRTWKTVMELIISNVTRKDFGNYFCEAKNELSATRGVVKLHEIDVTRYTPATEKIEGLNFGPEPPNYAAIFNESCDTSRCCQHTKRKIGATNLKYCITVRKTGEKKKKSEDCILAAVGKPVYQTESTSGFGSWIKDSKKLANNGKYWRTLSQKPNKLFQYNNRKTFKTDSPPDMKNGIIYDLKEDFIGDSHVIYDNVFYYHSAIDNAIVAYDLKTKELKSNRISIHSLQTELPLYSTGRNYIDLSTDENGLWAIYGLENTEDTVVMKINETSFQPEFTLNISLSHYKFGEMFITCGILYGIESASEKNTRITFALDLFKEHILDIEIPFTNPVASTTVLNYNPISQMLYSWANGTQLTYPIKTEKELELEIEA